MRNCEFENDSFSDSYLIYIIFSIPDKLLKTGKEYESQFSRNRDRHISTLDDCLIVSYPGKNKIDRFLDAQLCVIVVSVN